MQFIKRTTFSTVMLNYISVKVDFSLKSPYKLQPTTKDFGKIKFEEVTEAFSLDLH